MINWLGKEKIQMNESCTKVFDDTKNYWRENFMLSHPYLKNVLHIDVINSQLGEVILYEG